MCKRFACVLLALFCTLPAVGCSGEEITSGDEPSAVQIHVETEAETEGETELTDGLPEKDMNGYALHILNTSQDSLTWADVRIFSDELDGEAVNDGLYNRRQTVENRFNCVMTSEENIPYGNGLSVLQASVNAGETTYQCAFVTEALCGDALPYCSSWNGVPYIETGGAHWNPSATSVFRLSGKQTALAGNVSMSVISRAVCMVFNKRIFTEMFPGDSLYAAVQENRWVLDTMLSYMSSAGRDLNGDGAWTADDQYGLNMGRGFKGYLASILGGAGYRFTSQDEEANLSFTMHTDEKTLNLVTKLMDTMMRDGFYYNEDTSCHGFQPADFFSSGHALFTQGVPHDIYKLRDMEDDLGILPMPKLTEGQEKYYSASWGGHVLMLPKTVTGTEELENIGICLEAMSFLGYYEMVPLYKEVALKSKTSRDEESSAMLDIVFSSASFDFGTNILYDSVLATGVLQSMWDGKDSSAIVSICKKQEKTIQKYIDKFLSAARDMP